MLRVSGIGLLCFALAGVVALEAHTQSGQKPKPPAPAAPAVGGDVTITVSYTGKGVVDDATNIIVFLFDHPNPGAGSRALGIQPVTKNGGVATFKGITASPVYVVAVYDEKNNYDGTMGPPPPGTPWAVYGVTAKTPARAVVPGPKGKITFRFDGSNRWK